MTKLAEAGKATNSWACLDCGKCTATCPISRSGAAYSPRRHVLATNWGDPDDILANGSVYQCLTCGLCDSRCPSGVGYTELVRGLREIAHADGQKPECPHGGALQSVMRMMADGGTKQDRLGWLTDDLKTEPEKGNVFFWTGCTMYYDAFFPEHNMTTLEGTKSSIKLMNAVGTEPVVSQEERCCGHDLLWNGDIENFEKLAVHNVNLVKESGATILVTPCAECLRTWKVDYEPFIKGFPLRTMHLTEYMAEKSKKLKLTENGATKVTYQDPCRLGRHLGVYDEPRDLLNAVPGVELEEMARSGKSATCCAGGTWSSCDRYSKRIQVDRLKEAKETGAEVLVTACPKCQVHFKCAMKDPNLGEEIEIEMRDVSEILAAALDQ